ncbi:carbohydrate ABC transporter permease [Euzebya sp.]|uniref:carbohydrate ABC transporter permease n=1 Tax=Euzebya sp. TaxID=1971409 RepID=UPI00351841BE
MHPDRALLRRHVLPSAIAAAFALPIALLVLGSLRAAGAPPPAGLELVPRGASLDAYGRLADLLPLGTYLRNSVVVVVLAVPLTVVVAALAGFGIRLLEGRAKVVAVAASVVVMLVPTSALWATRFEVYASAGLIGSLLPLVAPALMGTTPLLVLIYAWAFGAVDDAQLHAARLEGASTLATWSRIALPQVRTATLAVSVLAFTAHWGNFIDALLYIRGQENFTLPLGLNTLKVLRPTEFPLLLAGAVVFTLPSIGVFLAAHRIFTDDPAAALRGRTSTTSVRTP